jgi:hypothetical protein
MVVRPFHLEQTSEQRLPSGAIEQVTRCDLRFCTAGALDLNRYPIDPEVDLRHFRFFADFRSVLARMVEQHFIELGPRYLVRAIALGTETVFEIKLYRARSTGGHDFAAVFRQKVRIEFFTNTKPIERLHAERQERFANVEAREFFALQNDHAPPGLGEQRRRRAARRTSANDGDVIDVDLFHSLILAKLAPIQRWIGRSAGDVTSGGQKAASFQHRARDCSIHLILC